MKIKEVIKINKVAVKVRDVDIGVNPFMKDVNIKVSVVNLEGDYVKEDDLYLPNNTYIESEPYTKIFINAENRKIVNKLTQRGKDLLLWLLYEMEAGQDFIKINKVRYMKELSIKSVNTYKTALSELIRYGMLKESKAKDIYWINSQFFFNGNRIKKYKKQLINKDGNRINNKEKGVS